MRANISIQAILVVVYLWNLLPGHYNRPRSSLSGHMVQMHRKQPMAGCYFVLCLYICSDPLFHTLELLGMSGKGFIILCNTKLKAPKLSPNSVFQTLNWTCAKFTTLRTPRLTNFFDPRYSHCMNCASIP